MSAVEPLNFATEDDLKEYEAGLMAFNDGRMSEERFTPFRLQMGIYGQRQDGVQMIRVKLPGGRVTPDQFDVIADCVDDYAGNLDMPKFGHITTRQAIQAHFVLLKDTPAFLRRLADVGLTTREACGNTVRNVTACFLAGVCPAEHADVSRHAARFAEFFLRHPLGQQFPRKFKVTFSGCETDCGMSGMHDIGFIAAHRDGEPGFKVYAAGGLSTQPVSAIVLEEFVEEREMLLVAEALMRIHFKYSDRKHRARARMKYVLLKLGEEGFIEQYKKERADIEKTRAGDTGYEEAAWRNPSAPFPFDGNPVVDQHDGNKAVLLNVFRGDLTPAQMHAVAAAARAGNSNDIRVTTEQGAVIASVEPNCEAEVLKILGDARIETGFARGIADIVACPGSETCRLGITSSRGLASALQPLMKEIKQDADLSALRVKASGCQHSCGRHHIADLGFHGLVRKISGQAVPHYQLHVGGSGRGGEAFGFATDPVPAKHAPEAGIAVLDAYKKGRKDDQPIHDWAEELGAAGVNAILAPFAGDPGEVEGLIYDWSENQPFSTKDNKKGECAGAVLSMTDALVCEAQYELMLARAHADSMFWAEALASLKQAANSTARAFLVPYGEAPEADAEVFPLLLSNVAADADVSAGLNAVQQGLMDIDIADPAPGVLALRDTLDGWIGLAARRFAPVPEQTEAASEESTAKASGGGETLLDLSGVACPMNFVKTKLKLETLAAGEKLAVILDDGEPIESVPRSLEEQGQKVIEQERISDTQWRIVVEKSA